MHLLISCQSMQYHQGLFPHARRPADTEIIPTSPQASRRAVHVSEQIDLPLDPILATPSNVVFAKKKFSSYEALTLFGKSMYLAHYL